MRPVGIIQREIRVLLQAAELYDVPVQLRSYRAASHLWNKAGGPWDEKHRQLSKLCTQFKVRRGRQDPLPPCRRCRLPAKRAACAHPVPAPPLSPSSLLFPCSATRGRTTQRWQSGCGLSTWPRAGCGSCGWRTCWWVRAEGAWWVLAWWALCGCWGKGGEGVTARLPGEACCTGAVVAAGAGGLNVSAGQPQLPQ